MTNKTALFFKYLECIYMWQSNRDTPFSLPDDIEL